MLERGYAVVRAADGAVVRRADQVGPGAALDVQLATGRLGVGLLLDLDGRDTYKLAPGSGGAGFAGIGILCDAAGNDIYTGSKWTQGVAVGGIGLLYDLAQRSSLL